MIGLDIFQPAALAGGRKGCRFADVAELSPRGSVVNLRQVGRANKNGTPVAREVHASNDIFIFGALKDGTKAPTPIFHEYKP